MVITKEILTDYKEIYEKAIKLVNEESKNDPPTDPYRSHYNARDLLLEMRENLKSSIASVLADEAASSGDSDCFTYTVILAFVCRDLGRICVFTEEPIVGETLLLEGLKLVEEQKIHPDAIIPYVGALNELGIVQASRQEYKKAFEMLSKAEQAYNDFKASGVDALCISDIFGNREEVETEKANKELENLYTLCSFYLAQVYGHLGELEKSAKYCHMTLRRQLESKTYDPIDFALNAATLSQYFIGQNLFKEARHHLAAATVVITENEKNLITPEMTDQQRDEITETYKHRYADVARCWSKYGLTLLNASKQRLFNDDEDKLAADVQRLTTASNDYEFPDLDLIAFEERVSTDYCLTFEDAKLVYHFVINWLDQAKEYYTAENEATEYAKIIKDYAELYKHIAFFEEDPVNQAKMQKRRVKYYEDLLELLNPVFYLSICRECWYGAGVSYCAILDIKLDALKDKFSPNPQEVQKVNQVCQKAIKHFMDFVKSYTDKDSDNMKANLQVDEQQGVLYTYFYLGRLHYKMITSDQALQLENMSNSFKYYKLFTDECAAHKAAAEILQAEIGVCREMVKLLPLKIAQIKKRLGQ